MLGMWKGKLYMTPYIYIEVEWYIYMMKLSINSIILM
jgi:hypothetical protein